MQETQAPVRDPEETPPIPQGDPIPEAPGTPDEPPAPEPENQHENAAALFMVYAADFVRMELVDRGRSLQMRGSIVNPNHGMKLRLSPIESRHEAILRAMVTGLSSALNRIDALEARFASLGLGEQLPEPPSQPSLTDQQG